MSKTHEPTEPETTAEESTEQLPLAHPRWGFSRGAVLTFNQAMALLPPTAPGAADRPQLTAAERYAQAKGAYQRALAQRDAERAHASGLGEKLESARRAFGQAEEAALGLRRRIEDSPVEAAADLVGDLAAAEAKADAAFRALRGLEDRWRSEGAPPPSTGSMHLLGVAAQDFRAAIVAAELQALPDEAMGVLRRAFAVWGGGAVDENRWAAFLAEHLPLRRQRVDLDLVKDLAAVRVEVLEAHGFRVA